MSAFKREYIVRMLAAHGGNRTRTAKTLGLERTYLLKLIRDFQLKEVTNGTRKIGTLHVQVKSS